MIRVLLVVIIEFDVQVAVFLAGDESGVVRMLLKNLHVPVGAD